MSVIVSPAFSRPANYSNCTTSDRMGCTLRAETRYAADVCWLAVSSRLCNCRLVAGCGYCSGTATDVAEAILTKDRSWPNEDRCVPD